MTPVDAGPNAPDAGMRLPIQTAAPAEAVAGPEPCIAYVPPATIGTPCPVGDFVDPLPSGPLRFVRPGAVGGDGSQASPFGTIGEAMAGAPSGTSIVLAKGTYDGQISFRPGVMLVGACPAETILTATERSDRFGVLDVIEPRTAAKNLSIRDANRPAVWSEADGSITLEDVVIERAERLGIVLPFGGTMIARRVVVTDTRPGVGGVLGRGIEASDGGRAVLEDVVVDGSTEIGVSAIRGGRIEAVGLLVRSTALGPSGAGRGINIGDGSTLMLEDAVIEGNADANVVVEDGAFAEIRDTFVRDARGIDDGTLGHGVSAQRGGSVQLENVCIEGQRNAGLVVTDEGSIAEAADVRVDYTQADSSGLAAAVTVAGGGRLDASRITVANNDGVGVLVSGAGSHLTLADGTIVGTDPGEFARSFVVERSATASVSRVALTDNATAGLLVSDGASVTVEDLTIDNVQYHPDGTLGYGVVVQAGANLELRRTWIFGARDVAFLLDGGGTSAFVEDISIAETQATINGYRGRGIQAQQGARATITNAVVHTSHELSVAAYGSTTALDLQRIDIRETKPRGCADSNCFDNPAGTGLGAYESASITAEDFIIFDAHLCGVQLARDGEIDLRRGVVTESAIGACVQNDGYDLDRLTDQVVYVNNGRNLESTNLPIPESGL